MCSNESSISNAAKERLSDPKISSAKGVISVAIRTECASPGKLFGFRVSRNRWEKRKLLKEQLLFIKKKDEHFVTNDILCCIRKYFDIVGHLIKDAEISTLAKLMPF